MQAKYCLLFVLLIGSIIASTDGFVPSQRPAGRKREFEKIQRDLCRAAMQVQCCDLAEDEGMKG